MLTILDYTNTHLMKILFVSSGNFEKGISPFVKEQADSLIKYFNISINFYLINGKGFFGYLGNLYKLMNYIKQVKPDIIHAHYGLSGLLANFQRKKPVITTYHGSDINEYSIRYYSILAAKLSKYNIFVSTGILKISGIIKNCSIIPCGVNISTFYPVPKEEARLLMNLNMNTNIILFSSAFNIKVKNYSLAKRAISLSGKNLQIIELKGYTRQEANLLLNACDVALMTSFNEGSPQFIKEAMACNCPIVATDVGDVKNVIGDTAGCFITTFDPVDVSAKIRDALKFAEQNGRTSGRNRIIEMGLDSETISKRIIDVYYKVLEKNKRCEEFAE